MVGMTEAPAPGTPLAPGDEIELDITGIAHGGVCVARHEGRVVFVADTIPGERVLARVTEARKKSFARAATVTVLRESEHRRPHIWAEAALERDPDHEPDREAAREPERHAAERQQDNQAGEFGRSAKRTSFRRGGTLGGVQRGNGHRNPGLRR